MKDYTKLKNAFHKLQSLYITEVRSNPKHIINEAAFKNDWDEAAGLIDGLNYQEQPVRKTLDECNRKIDEVAQEYIDSFRTNYINESDLREAFRAGADYAQAKAVEPQEGWVSIKDRMPEENQLVDIWKHDSYRDDWFRQINVIYKDEHICEFSHWMPSFLPPTQTNN